MANKRIPMSICINDMHIGKDNILDFEDNWDEMLDYAVNLKVKRIIIGGDTFLSRVSQSLSVLITVKKCIDKAIKLGFEIFNAPGNHDKVSLEDTLSYCHVFDGIPGYNVISEYHAIDDGDTVTHIIPHFPETGSFKKRLEEVVKTINKTKENILYIHEGINGALAHSDETNNKELPTHIFDDFDTVLVAHYHNRVQVGDDGRIFYVGSSRQHNFGEDEKKGYTVIFDNGDFKYLENKTNSRYKTLSIRFEEIDSYFYEEISELKADNYYVRVEILCTKAQRKLINKSDFTKAGAVKIKITEDKVVENEIDDQSSGTERFNKDGLVTIYSGFFDEKFKDGEIDIDFGLKYIGKIKF